MNRRIALSITFIAMNLMACCCGGVGPAKGPKPAATPSSQVAWTSDKIKAINEKYAPILERQKGRNEAEEDARIASAKKSMSDELAVVQAEIDAIAAKVESNLAAKKAEAEAALPKVSRANYNKLRNGISLADAQAILGPGQEVSQSGGIQTVVWEQRGLLKITTISCTFHNGRLQAKAIFGD